MTRPVVLVALAILLLNDHLLKATVPGFVTGKLSDAAGLFVAPFLMAAVIEIGLWLVGRRRLPSNRWLMESAAIVMVAFALVKSTALGAVAYAWILGWLQWAPSAIAAALAGLPTPDPIPVMVAQDPTDLLMLPAAALAVVVGRDDSRQGNDNAAGRRDPAALTWTVISWATGLWARKS